MVRPGYHRRLRRARERGIWDPRWLRFPGELGVLCAIWTSRRQHHGQWWALDVRRIGPLSRSWWTEALRRRELVLCGGEHRSTLALQLVRLGERVLLPTIYCGETG